MASFIENKNILIISIYVYIQIFNSYYKLYNVSFTIRGKKSSQ